MVPQAGYAPLRLGTVGWVVWQEMGDEPRRDGGVLMSMILCSFLRFFCVLFFVFIQAGVAV
jgi:hypothetical protein